jgi:hypothetical protein
MSKTTTNHLTQPRTQSHAAQEARQATPPARNTQSKRVANGVTSRFQQMENKVQQLLAVMDKDTGQLLNYRQLIRNPKYTKEWKISAENEFDQLAQGVGGWVVGEFPDFRAGVECGGVRREEAAVRGAIGGV